MATFLSLGLCFDWLALARKRGSSSQHRATQNDRGRVRERQLDGDVADIGQKLHQQGILDEAACVCDQKATVKCQRPSKTSITLGREHAKLTYRS
jgi:hypothetical protein